MNETNNTTPIDLETRPTNREMGKILDICGYNYQEFGKQIGNSPSWIGKLVAQYPLERLHLKRIDALRKLVGEENYYKALTEIRREAQKK